MTGRRHVSVDDEARWVFHRVAADYDRHRPGYPDALIAALLDLGDSSRPVVELGAGTGLVTLPLARAGRTVRAVEPARGMAEALAARVAAEGLPVEVVRAAGEATGLPPGEAGLVVAADAVQWLDDERAGQEARRLLAPGGAVAVVVVRLAGSPLQEAVGAVVEARNPKARAPARPADPARGFLAAALPRRPVERRDFRRSDTLSEAALLGLLRTHSFIGPALGEAGLRALESEAAAAARDAAGAPPWTWERTFELAWARSGLRARAPEDPPS